MSYKHIPYKFKIFTKVPKQIKENYAHLGLLDRLYVSIRWRSCPFEVIESYVPESGLILDMGCGYGILSNYMAIKPGRRIVGRDLSARRINIASSTVEGRDNIAFFTGDAMAEDIPEGGCSGIVATDFFHHISDEAAITILKKANKKLSLNGRLIIEDIDNKPIIKYIISLIIDKILNPKSKLYHRPARHLQHLLSISGFESEIIPVNKGLYLPDVLFICKKVKSDGPRPLID